MIRGFNKEREYDLEIEMTTFCIVNRFMRHLFTLNKFSVYLEIEKLHFSSNFWILANSFTSLFHKGVLQHQLQRHNIFLEVFLFERSIL